MKINSEKRREYDEWISIYLEHHNGFVRGRCVDACREMAVAFPELREVRGHVTCTWGKDAHVWLVSPDGEIVDPTKNQFIAIFDYLPWRPGDKVRVGRCMNCGDDIYRPVQSLDKTPERVSICGVECQREFLSYLDREMHQ